MENEDFEYRPQTEAWICDLFLSVAIGTGLAWWTLQWWFAP